MNYFASKKREGSNAKIIAVTGSAGKTSLKDLINTLLQNFEKHLALQSLTTITSVYLKLISTKFET